MDVNNPNEPKIICVGNNPQKLQILPRNSKAGTINPISGPAIYHGQGCLIESIFYLYKVVIKTNTPIASTNQPKVGFNKEQFQMLTGLLCIDFNLFISHNWCYEDI